MTSSRRPGDGIIEQLQAHASDREWSVIVDFMRKTDQQLLMRISRRMLNYLCWSGIAEAQGLLTRFASDVVPRDQGIEDNIPLRRKSLADLVHLSEDTFSIAARHLNGQEILACLEKWIKDDKSGFLMEALENQWTSLTDIAHALERYHQLSVRDEELSRALQTGLRASLARRFFTDDLDFINIAKNYMGVGDFYALSQRVISPPASHGKVGGKSSGMLLAAQIVRTSEQYGDVLGGIRVPKTWFIASDGLQSFVEHNEMEDVFNRKYLEIDQVRREYPHIVQVFKNSTFAPEILKGLSLALDDLEGRPLIVRSSSLLEDRIGAAFSGKYKSLFLANVGTKSERLGALTDAVAEVYASTFGPDPIEYRAERNLLDVHEEMGIMIQEVVGRQVGPYFMPAYAGVAFTNNEFRWSPRIRRSDGLVRLVPGLGTRAVDRVGDDYPVLLAPGQPGLRVNVTPDEIIRYSPRNIDVINVESRRFETVPVDDLFRRWGRQYPALGLTASTCGRDRPPEPVPFDWDPETSRLCVTFEGLVQRTPFLARMRALLTLLCERFGTPVDVEFASDGTDFYLLQCRPQSFSSDSGPSPIPHDLPHDRILFSARKYVSNGRVPDITHIVYVNPEAYERLEKLADLKEIGRVIGRLNKLLPRRQFVLMGPGRWGSRGDIKLGVNVTYSDINNTAVLIEIAARRGNYTPDLSFGTHFFQDLVEAGIRYLPLFPSDEAAIFNELFLKSAPSVLADLLPEYEQLADVVRVIDVPRVTDGGVLAILMNAELDEAVGFFANPGATEGPVVERKAESAVLTEEHWRWRLRMAESIASQLDPERFGVKGLYVFGSTKRATAGPGSDIDLLVHVSGTPEQRLALEAWLDGWSLCLSQMNYLRTGHRLERLLHVEYVTDHEVRSGSGWAAKIGAASDPARQLPLRSR